MTNKGLARRFANPTLIDPFGAFSEFDELFNAMSGLVQRRPALAELWAVPRPHDLSKDGESFSIWTKGTYPKLNIYANYTPSSEQSPEPEVKELVIEAAVPGCEEGQVAVNILGGEITIETNIHESNTDWQEEKRKRDASRHYFLSEVPERYSKMVVGVTGPFDYEAAQAVHEKNGMLRIVIPAKPIERERPKNLLGMKAPVSKVKAGKK